MQRRGRAQRAAKQLSAEEDGEGVHTPACAVHRRACCSPGEAKDGLDLPWERRICAARAAEQTGRQAPGERAACQSDFLALVFLQACSLSHGFSKSFFSVSSQPLKDCFPAWLPRAGSGAGKHDATLCRCCRLAGGSQTQPSSGSVRSECWTGNKGEERGFGFLCLGNWVFPRMEEKDATWVSWLPRLGTGLRKGWWRLVCRLNWCSVVGSGVGEIMSLLGFLAQDALASACPSMRGQHVPLVPTVPCSSPAGILQHWDPARSWDVPAEDREEQIYRQITGPRRGCCCQRLSFFHVSPTHCRLAGAFSQGKSVFPSPAGLLGLLTGFYCFISIGKNSPVSAQGLYQSRTGVGRGASAAPGVGVLLPHRGEPGPAFGSGVMAENRARGPHLLESLAGDRSLWRRTSVL